MENNSFIEKCLLGQAHPDEIDDYVDAWHEGESGLELHEFLGMTPEEYSLWITSPCSLSQIINSKKNPRP